jgi:SIR2-like domain
LADIADLVIYLSTGRAIAWVGAGPSVDIGLPTWGQLAEIILDKCKRKPNRFLEQIIKYYEDSKFPEMFDQVAIGYGKPFLIDCLSEVIKDPGGEGEAYKALSKLNFLAYFTTNFEQILLRHLEASGLAFQPYLNTHEDLASIDVDTIPTIVHAHGRLDKPDTLIVTRADYQRFYKNGDHQYFRDFIFSFLIRDRIVFIGYSLKDPDLIQIQETIATNLRRTVRSIAIIPNAAKEDIDYWSRYYNIDILTYQSLNNDHSELVSILSTTANFLAVGQIAPIRVAYNDLRDAEALYMWERFRTSSAGNSIKDALSSVVLDVLSQSPKGLTLTEIGVKLTDTLKINVVDAPNILRSIIDNLVISQWVHVDGDLYHLDDQQKQSVVTTERQFEDLIRVFRRQIELDVMRDFGATSSDSTNLSNIALETILDIFETRGHEVLQGIFSESYMNPANAADLIQIIWTRANNISNVALRGWFVEFILRMLTQPSDLYARVLSYLARAFFCIQALRMDPGIGERIRRLSSDRTIIIDANVLIPMTAQGEERFEFSRMLLDRARESGLKLCTTAKFIDEVRRHAQWALDRINEFGAQSIEILYAARGEGGYDSNAFLKGFISYTNNKPESEFIDYLRDCFGGSFQRAEFEKYITDILGIRIINDDIMSELVNIGKDAYSEAQSMMIKWNQSRDELGRKSERRINSEAEVYCLLKEWELFLAKMPDYASSNITFLTSGSGIGRVAKSANLIGRSMLVASPDALWQLLKSLPESNENQPSFRSLILTSYFRLASYFVDSERYNHFFEPLIRQATTSFNQYKESLEEAFGKGILPESLDNFAPENRPMIIDNIEMLLNTRLSANNADQKRLVEQNARLRQLVEEYQQREKKRREFNKRQRRNQ